MLSEACPSCWVSVSVACSPLGQVLVNFWALDEVVELNVTLRFGELGSVALIATGRQAVLLLAHHPVQIVGLHAAAVRAVQRRRLGGLTLGVVSSLVHQRSPVLDSTAAGALMTAAREDRSARAGGISGRGRNRK